LTFMAKNFAGFDTAYYPGDSKMQSLWDHTNLYWCGFYLGPRFNWSPHFTKIKGMGWGVAPIYTGKQPKSPKLQAIKQHYAGRTDALRDALYANGKADGVEAVQQAGTAGIPAATILYFDVENTVHDSVWLAYYRGWSRAVVDMYYSVGIYTRSEHASWLNAQLMAQPGFDICFPEVWIAKYTKANPNGGPVPDGNFLSNPFPEPNPSDSWRGATSWQHLGNFGLKWKDETNPQRPQHLRFAPVDFDSSIYSDPGLGILSIPI
jgi:hypothetical protein